MELPYGHPTDEMVHIPGGPYVMGTDDGTWALDNERPAHEVEVDDYYLDKTPVTSRAYLEFVEDGGYEKAWLWNPEGWDRIRDQGISAPKHWYQSEPHSWWPQRFGFDGPLSLDAPVVAVFPASRASPTESTPKSSSAPTTRCCAGAPGPPGPTPSATPSATGTTRSGASCSWDFAVRSRPHSTFHSS